MEILRGFRDIALDVEGSVISIGNFDGVHRGHEAVISSAVGTARAAGLASVVCTFDPHTRVFLDPDKPPRLLETLGQRTRAIERLRVDVTVVIPFERDVALQPHEDFVRDFLVGALRTRQIHVSKDFSFGAGGRGTIEYLRQVGPELGFELDIVAPVMSGGAPISSTRIRDALAELAADAEAQSHAVRRRVGLPVAVVEGGGGTLGEVAVVAAGVIGVVGGDDAENRLGRGPVGRKPGVGAGIGQTHDDRVEKEAAVQRDVQVVRGDAALVAGRPLDEGARITGDGLAAGQARDIAGVLGGLEVVDEGAGGVLPHERVTPKASKHSTSYSPIIDPSTV